MKHIVLFSGGVQSAYVAWLISKREDPKDIILLFCDTKSEDLDTYRFRDQVAAFLNLPITTVSDGRNIWELCDWKMMIPTFYARFCSQFLKIFPAEKFYKTLEDNFILYVGYGPKEYRRMQKLTSRNLDKKYQFPLFDLGISKDEVKRVIRDRWKICLPRSYKYFDNANCIPCFMMSTKYWYQVWKHFPNEFAKTVRLEKKWNYHIRPEGFLKDLERDFALANSQAFFWSEEDSMPCICSD